MTEQQCNCITILEREIKDPNLHRLCGGIIPETRLAEFQTKSKKSKK